LRNSNEKVVLNKKNSREINEERDNQNNKLLKDNPLNKTLQVANLSPIWRKDILKMI
jgi:hypothetical protein